MAARRKPRRQTPTPRPAPPDEAALPPATPQQRARAWLGDALCIGLISFWLAQFLMLLIRVLLKG